MSQGIQLAMLTTRHFTKGCVMKKSNRVILLTVTLIFTSTIYYVESKQDDYIDPDESATIYVTNIHKLKNIKPKARFIKTNNTLGSQFHNLKKNIYGKIKAPNFIKLNSWSQHIQSKMNKS